MAIIQAACAQLCVKLRDLRGIGAYGAQKERFDGRTRPRTEELLELPVDGIGGAAHMLLDVGRACTPLTVIREGSDTCCRRRKSCRVDELPGVCRGVRAYEINTLQPLPVGAEFSCGLRNERLLGESTTGLREFSNILDRVDELVRCIGAYDAELLGFDLYHRTQQDNDLAQPLRAELGIVEPQDGNPSA